MYRKVPTIPLNNGLEIPNFGLGTWLAKPGEIKQTVQTAIELGYRLFDCATLYKNEHEIGDAISYLIQKGIVKREDLFITTKLWNTYHEIDKVVPQCINALKEFNLEYLDLYLMHWPVAQKDFGVLNKDFPFEDAEELDYDFVETWKGLEDCVKKGLTKSIGVSNFNRKQLERLLNNCKIKPVTNQIEVHPNLNQKQLIQFCNKHGIVVTAYSPLGSPGRPWSKPDDPILSLTNPKLMKIGEKYKKTVPQIILRYVVQLGCVPIPKSTNPQRLKENIDIFDFALNAEEILVLDGFNCNGRVVHAIELQHFKEYPFKNVEF